jgi:hypothetical protein
MSGVFLTGWGPLNVRFVIFYLILMGLLAALVADAAYTRLDFPAFLRAVIGVAGLIILFYFFVYMRARGLFARGARVLLPPVVVLMSDVSVKFLDPAAKRARYVKTQTCLVNTDSVESYVEEGMAADGGIDIKSVGEGNTLVREFPTTEDRSHPVYKIEFSKPKKKGEVFKRVLEAEYTDSFPGLQEYYSLKTKHHSEDVHVKVLAHPDRPFTNAWVEVSNRGVVTKALRPEDRFEVKGATRQISELHLHCRNPQLDSVYTIWWEWEQWPLRDAG